MSLPEQLAELNRLMQPDLPRFGEFAFRMRYEQIDRSVVVGFWREGVESHLTPMVTLSGRRVPPRPGQGWANATPTSLSGPMVARPWWVALERELGPEAEDDAEMHLLLEEALDQDFQEWLALKLWATPEAPLGPGRTEGRRETPRQPSRWPRSTSASAGARPGYDAT